MPWVRVVIHINIVGEEGKLVALGNWITSYPSFEHVTPAETLMYFTIVRPGHLFWVEKYGN